MAARTMKPAAEVLARRMPGGAVLVHLGSNRIFELNETGARVWELLNEGLDQEQVLQRIVEEFDVDPPRAGAELRDLLERLAQERLLSAE